MAGYHGEASVRFGCLRIPLHANVSRNPAETEVPDGVKSRPGVAEDHKGRTVYLRLIKLDSIQPRAISITKMALDEFDGDGCSEDRGFRRELA